MTSPPSTPKKASQYRWGFGSAAVAVVAVLLWAEALVSLASATRGGLSGAPRLFAAIGMFACLVPAFMLLLYRWPLVFSFFRSVKVGVANLVVIGIGSIIGVLFHQEDPNHPLDQAAIESLVDWVDEGQNRPWSVAEQRAYDAYAGLTPDHPTFRNAHAFFLYRFAEALHLDGLLGIDEKFDLDPERVEARVAGYREKWQHRVEQRFGPEPAVALLRQSVDGLTNQQHDRRIEEVERLFDDSLWSTYVWANRLDLIRVYKSDWFAAAWMVLFLGVLSNTFRGGWRRLLRPGKWPFVATHLGVMLVIIGGGLSRMTEQRGMVELNAGNPQREASGTWLQYREMGTKPQEQGAHFGRTITGAESHPFVVRLDAFRADHHDVLSVNYLVTGADGSRQFEFPMRQPEERLWDGRTLRYDFVDRGEHSFGPAQLRIEVLDLIEQSQADFSLRPAGPEEVGVARVHLQLLDPAGRVQGEKFLSDAMESVVPLVHAKSGARVLMHLVPDLDRARALLAQPVVERFGFIHRQEAVNDRQFTDVHRLGEVYEEEIDGETWRVEVLQLLPHLVLEKGSDGAFEPAPMTTEMVYAEPRNPAIQLLITNPAGETEKRWVLEADQGGHLPEKFPQLHYEFFWDRWSAPAVERHLLLMTPDGQLHAGKVGVPDSLHPLPEGGLITFGDGSGLRVDRALINAATQPLYTAKADVDFFDPAPAAAHLRISYPDGQGGVVQDEVWLRTRDGRNSANYRYTAASGAQRDVVLFFREQTDVGMPKEWQSKLTMLEADASGRLHPVHTGTIRVNDYLHYRGYRFFQTSHNPRDPTYSGIGVVYDPGIIWVLSGFYLVMFGTIVVFLIKPIFTRKHRSL